MKKCASCIKDLPDAALHCVFCGAKQPPAPAVQQGMAKTAFGYSPNELAGQRPGSGLPPAPPAQAPRSVPMAFAATVAPPPPTPAAPARANPPSSPPPTPAAQGFPAPQPSFAGPPQPPSAQSYQPPQPGYPPPQQSYQPPQQPAPQGYPPPQQSYQPPPQPEPQSYQPPQQSYQAPPQPAPQSYQPASQGSFVPTASAAAKTMFVQSAGPASPQAQMPSPAASPASMQPTLVPNMPPPQPVPMQPAVAPMQMQPAPRPGPSQPIAPIPAAQPPPYARAPSRAARPIDPWRNSLRQLMFLWGVALLAAFATPLTTSPELSFHWKVILEGAGTARLPPLMLAAVGLLSVLLAAIPMPTAARGAIAALLGLAGIGVPIALVGLPPWQALAGLAGMLLLVTGLVIRGAYRDAFLPRLLVTIGALGVLAPMLIPQGGAIPLIGLFKLLLDAPGLAKLGPALQLGLFTVVLLSLLAWLPAPVSGGAGLWAWILILWSLVLHGATLATAEDLGALITQTPNAALTTWISGGAGLGAAYLALVGYGLASLLGKQLE